MKYFFTNLFNRNYNAVVKRGCINPDTTIPDFIAKMEEEYFEICNAHIINENHPNKHMISEVFDLMVVCICFIIHYKIDIVKGLISTAKKNESR